MGTEATVRAVQYSVVEGCFKDLSEIVHGSVGLYRELSSLSNDALERQRLRLFFQLSAWVTVFFAFQVSHTVPVADPVSLAPVSIATNAVPQCQKD